MEKYLLAVFGKLLNKMTSYGKDVCCRCRCHAMEMDEEDQGKTSKRRYVYYPSWKPYYKRYYARRAYDSYLGKRRKRDDDSWNDVDSDIVDKTSLNRKNNGYTMEHVYG